ncbi:MAG: cell division protein FtsA [Neisseria sp.]|nr:cell division protein FtsA [Neisseria sp.]
MVAAKQYISAIDIGTSKVIAVIGEIQEDNEIHIVGWGETPSRGLKAGMVTNIDATAQAIEYAVREAELMADYKVGRVATGIAGSHIRSINSCGMIKIGKGEVTQTDIERAIDQAKSRYIPPEYEILHTVVQEYIIDNQPGVKDPIGMSGVNMEMRVHMVTGAVTALQNIEKCINRCGLHMDRDKIVLQSLASGQAVLSEDEKEMGVCLIDIGAGTTDIAVYTNGAIRHTAVIPVAGNLITSDLAQALRTPYAAAEQIKIQYGAAHPDLDNLDEMVDVPNVGGDRRLRQADRRLLATVIGARVEEIFELVLRELHQAGFSEEVLISGVVLTGGASLLPGVVDVAEDIFGMSARIGVPETMSDVFERVRNPRYATVAGLLLAARDAAAGSVGGMQGSRSGNTGWWEKVKEIFRNF